MTRVPNDHISLVGEENYVINYFCICFCVQLLEISNSDVCQVAKVPKSRVTLCSTSVSCQPKSLTLSVEFTTRPIDHTNRSETK